MKERSRQLRWVMLVSLSLFVSAMLTVTALTLWRLHADAISNGLGTAKMHSRSFEDFLTQTLHVVELDARNYAPVDGRAASIHGINDKLTVALRYAPFLRSMSILDQSGHIVASSNSANVGVRVMVQTYQPDGPAAENMLRMGLPWSGRDFADGQLSSVQIPVGVQAQSFIPIARTLSIGSRRLTLLVALNPDHFINHILQSLGAQEGSLDVVRYDGTLLMTTDPQARIGSMQSYVTRYFDLSVSEFGSVELDRGGERPTLSAFRASRLYPFVVVTHINRSYALRNWKSELWFLLGVVAPVLLAIIGLTIVFYRRQLLLLRQHAEAERLQRINATVFDASAEAIIITDRDANIVAVNAAFTRMNGYSAQDALGRNPRMLASGMNDKDFYVQLWQELLTHGVWTGEMINRRKNGSFYAAQATITTYVDKDGALQHFIGVVHDVTERKKMHANMKRNAVALQRFAEVTAHHLQEPARRIASYAERLTAQLSGRIADEDAQYSLTTIGQQALKMRKLLGDVERYLAADQPRDVVGNVDVRAVVSDVLLRLDADVLAAGAIVAVGDLPTAWIDAPRLADLFFMALENALQFAGNAMGDVPLRIVVEGQSMGLFVRFRISDSGPGIAEEYRERVFRVFEQLRSGGRGSGIGLAIVRRIADSCGGRAWIEETPGGGCCLLFELPVEEKS